MAITNTFIESYSEKVKEIELPSIIDILRSKNLDPSKLHQQSSLLKNINNYILWLISYKSGGNLASFPVHMQKVIFGTEDKNANAKTVEETIHDIMNSPLDEIPTCYLKQKIYGQAIDTSELKKIDYDNLDKYHPDSLIRYYFLIKFFATIIDIRSMPHMMKYLDDDDSDSMDEFNLVQYINQYTDEEPSTVYIETLSNVLNSIELPSIQWNADCDVERFKKITLEYIKTRSELDRLREKIYKKLDTTTPELDLDTSNIIETSQVISVIINGNSGDFKKLIKNFDSQKCIEEIDTSELKKISSDDCPAQMLGRYFRLVLFLIYVIDRRTEYLIDKIKK